MNSDDFIKKLSTQWQQEKEAPAYSLDTAIKNRRKAKVMLGIEYTLAIIAIVFAVLFWTLGSGLIFNVSGLVLFLSGVLSITSSHKISRSVINWQDWSPEGIIVYNIELCDSAIKKAVYSAWSCLFLIAFTGFIWITVQSDSVAVPVDFAELYASITLPVAFSLLIWSRWRIHRKSKERIQFQGVLDEYTEADATG